MFKTSSFRKQTLNETTIPDVRRSSSLISMMEGVAAVVQADVKVPKMIVVTINAVLSLQKGMVSGAMAPMPA